MTRAQQKLKIFADFAMELSKLSTCKRAQVGAVTFPLDFTEVHSIGYNGPPMGESNDSCKGTEAVGACGCAHAEANAIARMGRQYRPTAMITTLSPCEQCAAAILNAAPMARLSLVLYVASYRDTSGILRLRNAGLRTFLIREWLEDDGRIIESWRIK